MHHQTKLCQHRTKKYDMNISFATYYGKKSPLLVDQINNKGQ